MLTWLKKFTSKKRNVFLLFLCIGFLLYTNTLGNKMFWDDQDNILFNEYVHNWKYFFRYFTENNVAGRGLISNYWRPLPLIVWSVEWHLWQDWAPGYHLVQITLHATAVFLLFILLKKLFQNSTLSLLTSILFLVHPLQTEAITYVSGISDPLSAIFLFTSLIFYIKWRKSPKSRSRPSSFYFSLFTFCLSFLARETAVFFLGYFVLVELVVAHLSARRLIKNLWPYLLLVTCYVLLRSGPLNFQNTFNLYNEQNEFTQNYFARIFTFFRVVSIYFQLLFWPFNLHMERSVNIATTLWHPDILIGTTIFFISIALAFYLLFTHARTSKSSLVLPFSILLFWIGLFPTSNILIPINGLLFEHWLYIPMAGFWLLLVWLGLKLKHTMRSIFVVCCMLFVVFLSARTIKQNTIWHDPIRFYNYTLKFAPQSYRVLNNLGMAYADEGDHNNAVRVYQLAISENPQNAVAYHNLGNSYKALGNRQLAIDNYKKAISLQPTFFFSYNALAQLYYEDKDYKNAADVLQKLYEQNHDPRLIQLIEQICSGHCEEAKPTRQSL